QVGGGVGDSDLVAEHGTDVLRCQVAARVGDRLGRSVIRRALRVLFAASAGVLLGAGAGLRLGAGCVLVGAAGLLTSGWPLLLSSRPLLGWRLRWCRLVGSVIAPDHQQQCCCSGGDRRPGTGTYARHGIPSLWRRPHIPPFRDRDSDRGPARSVGPHPGWTQWPRGPVRLLLPHRPHPEHLRTLCSASGPGCGILEAKVMSASVKPRFAGRQPSSAVGCPG